MAEALQYAPETPRDSVPNSPFANIRYIPEHLTRRTLKTRVKNEGSIPEDLWTLRGRKTEEYVQDVIATQTDTVDRVEINENWDTEGPDLTVHLVRGFRKRKKGIEVKSSTLELHHGKKKIRSEIFTREADGQLLTPWAIKFRREEWGKKTKEEQQLAISQRLTDKGEILINGGEKNGKEKTPEEILRDSYYPQLTRAVENDLGINVHENPNQLGSFPGLNLLWISKYYDGMQQAIQTPDKDLETQPHFDIKRGELIQVFPMPIEAEQLNLQLVS